jgi:hypothetical protein
VDFGNIPDWSNSYSNKHVGRLVQWSTLCNLVATIFRQPGYMFVCFAYQSKDIVFRFTIEYSSLKDFGP